MSIIYTYIWGAEKLDGAFYVPNDLGALL